MDYVDLFARSNLVKGSPFSLFSLIFLVVGRIVPIIAMAPFFGAKVLPHPVKVVLSICLMVMVLPKVVNQVTEPLAFNTTLIFLMIKELFIGTLLGFFVSLPFLIVSSSGTIIDHQRGAASLMVNDPTIQNQASPIGQLFNLILIVLFFNFGGPFYVIDTVLSSYDLVPPDKFLSPIFFSPESPITKKVESTMHDFVATMLQFAMPGLLVILMTDTFLGIINRLAPQVQITFLGMGLKSWLAIFIVCIGWSPFVEQMGKEIVVWLRDFLKLVQDLSVGQTSMPAVP
jgi:type III secretion protein T